MFLETDLFSHLFNNNTYIYYSLLLVWKHIDGGREAKRCGVKDRLASISAPLSAV